MGLLDDAIREHLELKRRRGADPAEIERDEQEALGPVRRAPEEEAQPDLDAASEAPEGEHEGELAEPWDDPFADESEALAEEPGLFDAEQQPLTDEESQFEDEESQFEEDDPFRDEPPSASSAAPTEPDAPTQIFDHEPDEGPPPPRATTPPPSRGHLSEETAEFDVQDVDQPADAGAAEEEHAAADQGHEPAPADQGSEKKADEDVLEETPEFLQDTPDHDRLWFEQRPPRDFDFDG
jgi:hypothetical protein